MAIPSLFMSGVPLGPPPDAAPKAATPQHRQSFAQRRLNLAEPPAPTLAISASILAVFIACIAIVGVYLSLLGVCLLPATGLGAAVGLLAALGLRDTPGRGSSSTPPRTRLQVAMVAMAVVAGALLKNDVVNKDPQWHISLVDHALWENTLLIPSFFSRYYSTKYDGWIAVMALASSSLGLCAEQVYRHANVLLVPWLVFTIDALRRVCRLSTLHWTALFLLALLFGGDGVRLLAFGGPRAAATILQIAGSTWLLAAYLDGREKTPGLRENATAALLLAGSGIVHSFYALANAVVVGGFLIGTVVRERRFTRAVRGSAVAAALYACLIGPYVMAKRTTIPMPESAQALPGALGGLAAGGDGSAPAASLSTLVSFAWGEHGTLIPFWCALLAFAIAARAWLRRGDEGWNVANGWLVATVGWLLVPLLPFVLGAGAPAMLDVISASRVTRLVPASPVVLAAVTWAMLVHGRAAMRSQRLARRSLLVALVVSAASLVPAGYQVGLWHAKHTRYIRASSHPDREYLSAAIYVGPALSQKATAVASSRRLALNVASVVKGYPVFFRGVDDTWWVATHIDTSPASTVPSGFRLCIEETDPGQNPTGAGRRSSVDPTPSRARELWRETASACHEGALVFRTRSLLIWDRSPGTRSRCAARSTHAVAGCADAQPLGSPAGVGRPRSGIAE